MEEVARKIVMSDLRLAILGRRREQVPEVLPEYKVNGTVILPSKLLIFIV